MTKKLFKSSLALSKIVRRIANVLVVIALIAIIMLVTSLRQISVHENVATASSYPNRVPRVALVIPFIQRQMDRVMNQLSLFQEQENTTNSPFFTACDETVGKIANFSLVLYTDLELGAKEKDAFMADLRRLAGRTVEKCFGNRVVFEHANLPSMLNKHPCGPCSMFYRVFKILAGGFDYFMIMEPDVMPVRQNWLNALALEFHTGFLASLNILPASLDFWMKGSVSQCSPFYGNISQRMDLHINGNAMFKLNDQGFSDYMDRVKSFYPAGPNGCDAGCATGSPAEGGHDHTLYRFRQSPENFVYVRGVLHRFQITGAIVNFCEDWYTASSIL